MRRSSLIGSGAIRSCYLSAHETTQDTHRPIRGASFPAVESIEASAAYLYYDAYINRPADIIVLSYEKEDETSSYTI